MRINNSILIWTLFAVAILGALFVYKSKFSGCGSDCMCNCAAQSSKELQLRRAMDELWEDHGLWTHDYLIAAIGDQPNKDLVTKRLLRNQDDIGAAIASYYGKEAGDKTAKLLREHILIAAEVVEAAKAGDQEKLKDTDARWHENAKDIAKFLSQANPNWQEKMLIDMLNEHLKLTTQEAVARIKKDWSGEIKVYDEVRKQLLNMAKDFSDGIIKQFPDKF